MAGGGGQRQSISKQQRKADKEFAKRQKELEKREKQLLKEQERARQLAEKELEPVRPVPVATPADPSVSGATRDAKRRANKRKGLKKGTIFAGETGGLGGSDTLSQSSTLFSG